MFADVEQLTDTTGDTKATYGYTAYDKNDDTHFTGIDKPDTADPTREPYNAYRYNAKRWDQHSQSYDMGFRDYSPGLNRFLTRDTYNGALADLNLGLNPFTGNRYAFGGGNPISAIEIDGHDICWSCIGEFAVGVRDGWNNWGTDTADSLIAFVEDPMGSLEAMNAEATAWNLKMGAPTNGSFGWTCVTTGICDIAKNIAEGNYYEAGYDTGGLAFDLTLAAATAAIGGAAGLAARGASALTRAALKLPKIPDAQVKPSFRPTGAGANLVRYAENAGTTYQFKTGHGFYRPHKSGTDLRTTSLTPDEVEAAIINDIEQFRSAGNTLASAGGGYTERTLDISGYSISYRAVQTGPTNVGVGTYWLN